MRMSELSVLVAIALAAVPACGGQQDKQAKPDSARSTSAGERAGSTSGAHAPGNVKPGSYEDWCVEHAVPESQCTRCNPALVAAFQATGDWCPEHGLPESQCLACNPGLQIVRPPKPDASQSQGG